MYIIQLPVMETFYSIQGEGSYQGHAAFFIRLGGCDVGCVWCDVKDSWDAEAHPKMSVEELVNEVKLSKTEIVIITGGEPLLYDCSELTEALQKENF
jgi:organic radical activating enzyme